MLNQLELDKAKHIVIVLDQNPSIEDVSCANALYTYILQLHKKVSLFCPQSDFALNLSFLPWMDKMKQSYPSSSDYEIKNLTSLGLFEYFQNNEININVKMATSLYAALLAKTQGFSRDANGIVFAMAKVLVEKNADVVSCNANVLHYQSLASLRLKTILLRKMILQENAQTALFELDEEDLLQSGASVRDAKSALIEALTLPTVNVAILKYNNKQIMKEVRN